MYYKLDEEYYVENPFLAQLQKLGWKIYRQNKDNTEIEKKQNTKKKLKRIKQGLMEDLLTGKVKVNHLIKDA